MTRHGLLVLIFLVGWGGAVVRLGERSLWADEGQVAFLAYQSESKGIVATLHRDLNIGPLHQLLMIGIVRLSHNEWALRLPSALTAVLALPIVYLLGCFLFSRTAGLVSAFLLAISPFAISYAQEAKPYALLELLACLSLLLLLCALQRKRWIWWAGFALSTSLLVYTHFFAWFVVAAEVTFALVLLLQQAWREHRQNPELWKLLASLIVVGLLYIPWLPALTTFVQQAGFGGDRYQGAGFYYFQLSFDFLRNMVSTFGARTYDWRLYVYVASILLGLASLIVRRKRVSLLLAALWFGIPLAVLTIVPSQHGFDFRYIIFLLPIFLLLVAEGVAGVARLVVRVPGLARLRQTHSLVALALACLLFVPANVQALRTHYRWEKENWRGIGRFVADNLQPDETLYVSPRFWAYPLLFYQPSLQPYLAGGSHQDVTQLQRAAKKPAGLWFLRFAGPLGDPTGDLTAWITAQQFELLIDGKACGWGIHVYYRRFDDRASSRQADLLQRAVTFCPRDPRFQPPPD